MDDDESLCKAVKRLLFASSITTNIFLSAESFLAEGHVREPDCLIVDIQLGGMSGLELQRSLHAVGRHIPIIFITAQDDPKTKAEAERAGCAPFLRKSEPGTVAPFGSGFRDQFEITAGRN